jgi:hypothetical protein
MSLLDYLKAFFRPGAPPPEPRRLDGRSKPLLTASLKVLPEEEPGWITMKAKILFWGRPRLGWIYRPHHLETFPDDQQFIRGHAPPPVALT